MGALLSLLTGEHDSKIFLDFENAVPTAAQQQLYAEAAAVLVKAPELIRQVDAYAGCAGLIQKALNSPSTETEDAAFQAVKAHTIIIDQFWKFAVEIESLFPRLLGSLLTPVAGDDEKAVEEAMADKTAPARQICEILEFAIKFDSIKMMKSVIQNDFSYYRRSMPKRDPSELNVSSEDANLISLFLAASSPMVNILNKALATAARQNENLLVALASLANICCSMVINERFANAETNAFCLRAMGGAIVVFDLSEQAGAFRKKSPISIKRCCEALCSSPLDVAVARNAVRYSTKHFDDADTPDSVKKLFD